MQHKGTKTIVTERLILRKFNIDDAQNMFQNFEGDPKVTEFLTWKCATSVDDAKQVPNYWLEEYENPNFYQWAIELKELGEPIGTISVVEQNEKIDMVLSFFRESEDNNIIFTYHSDEENKDVYMVALRDDNRKLIGFYEKHEFRNRETMNPYEAVMK